MDCDQMSGKCLCLPGVTGSKCDTCSNGKKLNKKGCVGEWLWCFVVVVSGCGSCEWLW